jgi:hypothetical protein
LSDEDVKASLQTFCIVLQCTPHASTAVSCVLWAFILLQCSGCSEMSLRTYKIVNSLLILILIQYFPNLSCFIEITAGDISE